MTFVLKTLPYKTQHCCARFKHNASMFKGGKTSVIVKRHVV